MREAVGLWVLLLAGCPKQATSELQTAPIHPDLKCPPGTYGGGLGPPAGYEAWCVRRLDSGVEVRDGPSIEWHSNESRKAEGGWVENKQHGPWLYWYPTGTPEQQGAYSTGVREGVWTSYHADGERASEGTYVDGKEHGMWTFWNNETLTRVEGEYVLGDRDGIWLDYGPSDKAVRERIYRDGRLTSQREL